MSGRFWSRMVLSMQRSEAFWGGLGGIRLRWRGLEGLEWIGVDGGGLERTRVHWGDWGGLEWTGVDWNGSE